MIQVLQSTSVLTGLSLSRMAWANQFWVILQKQQIAICRLKHGYYPLDSNPSSTIDNLLNLDIARFPYL